MTNKKQITISRDNFRYEICFKQNWFNKLRGIMKINITSYERIKNKGFEAYENWDDWQKFWIRESTGKIVYQLFEGMKLIDLAIKEYLKLRGRKDKLFLKV